MGNALCCCPDQDPSSASNDGPLKFLDSAGGKSNTGGSSSAPSAAATPDWPAPDSAAQPIGSAPQPQGSVPNNTAATTTTLGERLMLYPRYSEARAVALFEKYRDPDDDAVLAEGIVRLCRDLGVRPEEFRVLLLAWKFGARQMCRFSREEFLSGCRALRADSTLALRARFPDMREEARDPARFRDLYRFTFKFGLESGQRVLPTEMAAQLWRLVFSEAPPAVLERWLAFLEVHPEVRGITGDTWNMFLHFADTAGRDLSTYDDAEAWPSLFDDFVEFENDQTNQNVPNQLKGSPDEVKAD
ncbi:unnamed protein product [Ixodes hexagonus]